MEIIARIQVDPSHARVYEEGWQSWTPSGSYRLGQRPHRPKAGRNRVMHGRALPEGFASAGLLAVDPGSSRPIELFAAADVTTLPIITARLDGAELIVAAEAPLRRHRLPDRSLDVALASWADALVVERGLPRPRPAPTTWCSWYHYFTDVTEADLDENLDAMDRLDLPVDVVQLDDGYQSAIGDWLTLSDRFRSLEALAARIRSRGRRAGIWIAPFLVGSGSRLARRHPDWLVRDEAGEPIDAGWNWEQDLFALDVTHPGAAAHLAGVFETLRGWGFDFFKIDFVYAGALAGRRHEEGGAASAYWEGLDLVRGSIGDAYLLGCGAPILASIGHVDAMRVSPDTAPTFEPVGGDLSEPAIRSAIQTGRARAWQHGRFWVNDADCLIVRPEVERRHEWAAHVERYGGVRSSSDRLRLLDEFGIEATRRILGSEPARTFI